MAYVQMCSSSLHYIQLVLQMSNPRAYKGSDTKLVQSNVKKKNPRLVADEPVEFEKLPVGVGHSRK